MGIVFFFSSPVVPDEIALLKSKYRAIHSLLKLLDLTRTMPFDFSFYCMAESPSEQDEIKRIPCSAWLPGKMYSSFRGRACRGWGGEGGERLTL